ncbi:MAG: transposase [Opitutaceae bacterium]|nr:transposase [Opitutaceae bacterium]
MWWINEGIVVEFIQPASPQQNGSHERAHRDLKAEATQPPSPTWSAQQRRFDRWQHLRNHVRPHEALGMLCPAQIYRRSPAACARTTPRCATRRTGWCGAFPQQASCGMTDTTTLLVKSSLIAGWRCARIPPAAPSCTLPTYISATSSLIRQRDSGLRPTSRCRIKNLSPNHTQKLNKKCNLCPRTKCNPCPNQTKMVGGSAKRVKPHLSHF